MRNEREQFSLNRKRWISCDAMRGNCNAANTMNSFRNKCVYRVQTEWQNATAFNKFLFSLPLLYAPMLTYKIRLRRYHLAHAIAETYLLYANPPIPWILNWLRHEIEMCVVFNTKNINCLLQFQMTDFCVVIICAPI